MTVAFQCNNTYTPIKVLFILRTSPESLPGNAQEIFSPIEVRFSVVERLWNITFSQSILYMSSLGT